MHFNVNNSFWFLTQREQLADHEDRVQKLEMALEEHRRDPPDRSAKSLFIQNYKEKDAYLQYEVMILLIDFFPPPPPPSLAFFCFNSLTSL